MEVMRKVAAKFSKVDEIQAALASAYPTIPLPWDGWRRWPCPGCTPYSSLSYRVMAGSVGPSLDARVT